MSSSHSVLIESLKIENRNQIKPMTLFIRCLLIVFLSAINFSALSQLSNKISHQEVKQFEGTYEFRDNTTLQIAVSPKDTMLYALIGKSKYKLTPYKKNIFLTASKQEVYFKENESGATGFTINDDTPDKFYKRITKTVSYPN